MVRYTKRGSVDGEPNLILPPLSERVIQVRRSGPLLTLLALPTWLAFWGTLHLHARSGAMPAGLRHGCKRPQHSCHVPRPMASMQCTLCEEDERMYHQLKTEQRLAYRNILDRLSIDPDLLGGALEGRGREEWWGREQWWCRGSRGRECAYSGYAAHWRRSVVAGAGSAESRALRQSAEGSGEGIQYGTYMG